MKGISAASPSAVGIGLLIQNLSIQYAQAVTRFYDLASSNIYYIGGRTQGNVGLGRIIGPAGLASTMYMQLGDICKAKDNDIVFSLGEKGCDGAAVKNKYTCKFCLLNNIQLSVAAGDMIVNEQAAMMFSSLDI